MSKAGIAVSTLIVEDDQHKLDNIVRFLREYSDMYEIRVARAFQSALKAIRDWKPALILLDMSLPTYEGGGGRPRPFAGTELLHEIRRRRIPSKVVVMTQFDSFGEGPERKTLDQLRTEISREYREWYRDTVYYNPAESAWRDSLLKIISRMRDPI